MIGGIVGVIIWTEKLDCLIPFYRDILGLPLHSVRPHFVVFKWGDMRLSIGKHDRVDGQTREPYRIMINLDTQDIHQACRILSAKGVKFLRPPEQEKWGGWVSTFSDPDGNLLQILQQPNPYAQTLSK